MVFSSLTFVCLFLPAIAAAYFLSPARWRNLVLVIGSIIFYGWGIALILVLSLVAINYGLGLAIEQRTDDARRRMIFFAGAVMLSLATMAVEEYNPFIYFRF